MLTLRGVVAWVLAAALCALLAIASGPLSGCSGGTDCTPESSGLAAATRVLPIKLGTGARPCTTTAVQVLGDASSVSSLWAELGLASTDAGADPVIDFARERVVVVEHKMNEGISWAVLNGDTVVFGILACASEAVDVATCAVDVLRIDSRVGSGEMRSCGAVHCGRPQTTY